MNNTTTLTGSCPLGPTIVDFGGFGTTANCFKEAARPAAPSTTNSATRNTGGCAYTDNNNVDFATIAALPPRNSASPASPCPLPPGADIATTLTGAAGNDWCERDVHADGDQLRS